MMSLHKLPGVAEVAMQSGMYAGRRIKRELSAGSRTGAGAAAKPFKYRDLGSAAYIARGDAVVSGGPLKLHGLIGWFSWLFIHIAFLTGFRNRVGAVLTWWVAFTRDIRRERAFTDKPVGLLQAIYKPLKDNPDFGRRQGQDAEPLVPMPAAGQPQQRRRLALLLAIQSATGTARWYLVAAVSCGLALTGLIVAQAGLLAHVLATAGAGVGAGLLAVWLVALLVVVVGRAAASYGSEVAALRTAVAVKDRLRSRLLTRALNLGPLWLGRQRSGEIATLATSGLDSLDAYYTRYLPQVLLAVAVPVAVIVSMLSVDWLSGLIVAVTLPVIPLFTVLIGWQVKAQTRRNWRLLARLGGHFTDVVAGLATLKVFGRAKAQEQIIAQVTEEYRGSVMASLRVAFLSALVLELAAAVATALVAVEVGLRLLYGHLEYSTALFLLLLTPEAFLPVRNAAAAFHTSADGTAAAERAFELLDSEPTLAIGATGLWRPGSEPAQIFLPKRRSLPDLGREPIRLERVTLAYPERPTPVIASCAGSP